MKKYDIRLLKRFEDGILVSDFRIVQTDLPSKFETGKAVKSIFGEETEDTCRIGCSRCGKMGCLPPKMNLFVALMNTKDTLYIELKGPRCNCTLVIDQHN